MLPLKAGWISKVSKSCNQNRLGTCPGWEGAKENGRLIAVGLTPPGPNPGMVKGVLGKLLNSKSSPYVQLMAFFQG